jgi:Raf kinase inhibitor-like YbhB/YbcL family protein
MHNPQVDIDYKVLTLSSKAIAGKSLPKKYTCDGENINPPLDITGIPLKARSLVLMLEESLAGFKPTLHWLVWNLPVAHHIQEDIYIGQQGINDFGCLGYKGPCPPFGKSNYIFKVYALDELIDLTEGCSKNEIENAMQQHIIAYGELAFPYTRATF